MWNFLGGLVGGVSNLLGGLFGQSNQEKINQENIAQANFMAQNAIQMRVADAKKAGINPLAALGSSFQPGAPQLVGSDALPNALSSMGQNIARAAAAQSDADSKATVLNEELARAKIENVKADTVRMLADASKQAVTFGQPGTPPSFPYNFNLGGPPDPRPHKGMIALTQSAYDPRTGEVYSIPSEKAASPLQTLGAVPVNIGVAGRSLGEMIDLSWGRGLGSFIRPDVWRGVDSSQYSPF